MEDTALLEYIDTYRWHFNKKACDYAVSLMKKSNAATGKTEKIEPLTKDQVEELLTRQGVKLEHNQGYDFVYVANMAKADYLKSSIEDEKHLALFVKDTIDDVDAGEGSVMRCWVAKMCAAKKPIFWDEFLAVK